MWREGDACDVEITDYHWEGRASGVDDPSFFQDSTGQGEGAVEAAYLPAKKLPNPKIKDGAVWIPYRLITRGSQKELLNRYESERGCI